MPVAIDKLSGAVKQMREGSAKRKFQQSVDLAIQLNGIDPKKPEGRIEEDLVLPHPVGDPKKIVVFADGELARRAKDAGADMVLNRADLEKLGKDRKQAKKTMAQYDFCIAQADLMVPIGKSLGPVLGPSGKMPKPIPQTANPVQIIERMKKTLRIMSKNQTTLNVKVGLENMSDEHIADNARAVIDAVEHKLREKTGSIGSIQIKTTMGKPVDVGVEVDD